MSSFTKPFKVMVHNVPLKDQPFEIIERFEYYSKKYDGFTVIIPEGFRTDFASVPRAFWGIIPPIGRYSKACVVHDWLIDNIGLHRLEIGDINSLLFEAMVVLEVKPFYKYTIYGGVLFYWKIGRHIANAVRKVMGKERK